MSETTDRLEWSIKARAILQEIADLDPLGLENECLWCAWENDHDPTCLWLRARKLVGVK